VLKLTKTSMVALISLAGCLSFAASKPDQGGADLLTHAASLQNIREQGAHAFQVRMRIHAEHIVAKPMDGAYAEVWVAPDKWRREVSFPGFIQLETGDADSKWMTRDLDFRPRVAYLTALSLEAFIRPQLQQEDVVKSVHGKKVQGVEARCVDVVRKDGKYPKGLCFDSAGVLVDEVNGQHRFEYGDFVKFGEKIFPKSIRAYEKNRKVLEISAEITEPTDLRPELFQHTSTAHKLAPCERWEAVPEKKVAPHYPENARAGHQEGTVILYVLLSNEGVVERTSVLESAGKALDQSATEAVQQWIYSPITCGAVPLETEIEVSVNYELR